MINEMLRCDMDIVVKLGRILQPPSELIGAIPRLDFLLKWGGRNDRTVPSS